MVIILKVPGGSWRGEQHQGEDFVSNCLEDLKWRRDCVCDTYIVVSTKDSCQYLIAIRD